MKKSTKRLILLVYANFYSFLNRVVFGLSGQLAHDKLINFLRPLDRNSICDTNCSCDSSQRLPGRPTKVGGVALSQSLIAAAGLAKGDEFKDEATAMIAVADKSQNIIPGWRIVPTLIGPMEFGSFTRYPRVGNTGTVMWRLADSRSLQNRVGLKNPGARAAAKFLGARKHQLPAEFGINIAVSPDVVDVDRQEKEVIESLEFFLDEGVLPYWFTLNLSCPNTEDDPKQHQLEAETRQLCSGFINSLQARSLTYSALGQGQSRSGRGTISSAGSYMSRSWRESDRRHQYIGKAQPRDPKLTAGVGGGELFDSSLAAVRHLRAEIVRINSSLDVIACGGILDGESFQAYRALGIRAAQYWSALVYRGPLAAAVIESELAEYEYEREALHRESLA